MKLKNVLPYMNFPAELRWSFSGKGILYQLEQKPEQLKQELQEVITVYNYHLK